MHAALVFGLLSESNLQSLFTGVQKQPFEEQFTMQSLPRYGRIFLAIILISLWNPLFAATAISGDITADTFSIEKNPYLIVLSSGVLRNALLEGTQRSNPPKSDKILEQSAPERLVGAETLLCQISIGKSR